MGKNVFAAQLDTQMNEGRSTDWRKYHLGPITMSPVSLPVEVESKCVNLIKRLGLVFGCIDLIETPRGEWVFLEVNPMGQFIFVEFETGQQMIHTFCDLLVDRDPWGDRTGAE